MTREHIANLLKIMSFYFKASSLRWWYLQGVYGLDVMDSAWEISKQRKGLALVYCISKLFQNMIRNISFLRIYHPLPIYYYAQDKKMTYLPSPAEAPGNDQIRGDSTILSFGLCKAADCAQYCFQNVGHIHKAQE